VNFWVVMLIAGILTYATRLSFILLIGRRSVPPLVGRMLRYIPAAVLTAIIFPEILIRDGTLYLSIGNARLFAGLLAGVVAWKTRSAILTIIAGMATLWLIQILFL
jgi:branched-subunit amino acid transport protein